MLVYERAWQNLTNRKTVRLAVRLLAASPGQAQGLIFVCMWNFQRDLKLIRDGEMVSDLMANYAHLSSR